MKNRQNSPVLFLSIAVFFGLFLSNARSTERPNIIFILGDDQAWWDYSFMYRPDVEKAAVDMDASIYQVAETPSIDKLVDEGLTFTHGYTVPLCRPSLHAILTGMYPHQNRVSGNDLVGTTNDTAADERIKMNPSLARTLVKRLGYRAYQTGKWWGGPHQYGGFTEGDTANSIAAGTNPPQYTGSRPSYANRGRHGDWGLMIGRVDYVNDIPNPAHPINYANTIVPATDFIDSCVAGDDPFFMWYAPFLPHSPFDPPAGLRNKYDALIDEPDETNNHIAKYYANIERLDGGIGALLAHLDSAGIADNTMIVFICDNGWITNPASGGSTRSKRQPYDAGARTPIIIHWPKMIKSGGAIEPQIVTTPVSVIDMVTTALAAVDIDPAPEQRGIDLMDFDQVNARDAIYCDVYEHDMASVENPVDSIVANIMIKDGWKLIEFTNTSELYHLYDTTTDAPIDPFETNNLATTETARVAQMSQMIGEWYSEPKDMVWSDGASQMQGTTSIAIPDELGQSFSVEKDAYLVGINIPFQQTDPSETITVELRELDGNGAPLGDLIATSTVTPDPVYQTGFRWSLFAFENPVPVTMGQQLGFLVKSSTPPNTGFNVAYNEAGAYTGGMMYFSGLIEGDSWDAAGLDSPFQVLCANYDGMGKAGIFRDGNTIYAVGDMGVKGQPVDLQTSTDLAGGNWVNVPVEDNLDGLVAISETMLPERKFYRFRLSTIGQVFTVGTPEPATLYEELFDGTGINLTGELPNITTASETWAAPTTAVFLDDGEIQGTTNSSAHLPFTPQNGFTYTLEATFEQSSTDHDQWVTFGFVGATPAVTTAHSTSGIIWALTRNLTANDNQVLHENAGGGTGSQVRGNYVEGAATVSMKLVLHTTAGSGNWTYDWIVDGVARLEDRALSSSFESAIGGVGISKRAGTTSNAFSDFKLTRE